MYSYNKLVCNRSHWFGGSKTLIIATSFGFRKKNISRDNTLNSKKSHVYLPR